MEQEVDEPATQSMKSMETMGRMSWGRLAAMVAVSTLVMFPLMYQLVYVPEHLEFSVNRLLASCVMGAVMTALMLSFMWKMYPDGAAKMLVMVGALVLAVVLLLVNRQQVLVDDISFMRAMIPHHSIAINNAEKARISDPRVRQLADTIIAAQVKEIAEMKLLIADLVANGSRGNAPLAAVPAAVTPEMLPSIEEATR